MDLRDKSAGPQIIPAHNRATMVREYEGLPRHDIGRVAQIDQKAHDIKERLTARYDDHSEQWTEREYNRLLRNPDQIKKEYVIKGSGMSPMMAARNQAERTIYLRYHRNKDRIENGRKAMRASGASIRSKKD